jgi:hypothetical protein
MDLADQKWMELSAQKLMLKDLVDQKSKSLDSHYYYQYLFEK